MGKRDYPALEAKGNGKFVGWNVTVRLPGNPKSPGDGGYPVDENEKFFIDGEPEPSVEFQGMEDSFGFSWGFPETQSHFPLTGYFPFFKGACGYRFFAQDAISFEKSLRVKIGFGKNEDPSFRRSSASPRTGCNFRARCTGIRPSPTPRGPPCPRPPSVPRAGRPFLGGEGRPRYAKKTRVMWQAHSVCRKPADGTRSVPATEDIDGNGTLVLFSRLEITPHVA